MPEETFPHLHRYFGQTSRPLDTFLDYGDTFKVSQQKLVSAFPPWDVMINKFEDWLRPEEVIEVHEQPVNRGMWSYEIAARGFDVLSFGKGHSFYEEYKGPRDLSRVQVLLGPNPQILPEMSKIIVISYQTVAFPRGWVRVDSAEERGWGRDRFTMTLATK